MIVLLTLTRHLKITALSSINSYSFVRTLKRVVLINFRSMQFQKIPVITHHRVLIVLMVFFKDSRDDTYYFIKNVPNVIWNSKNETAGCKYVHDFAVIKLSG